MIRQDNSRLKRRAAMATRGNIVKYLIVFLLFAGAANAQQQVPDPVGHANQGTVGVITGMEGGTYARTGADLTILDDDTLRVLPTLGKGSLQNLSDILYLKGIDIGFVQADALTYAKQHGMFPSLTQSIRYIAKLYDEEVHVAARKDIQRIEDLNGQRVNVDVNGSGSAMTAEIVLDALGIKPKLENQPQVTGIEELKRGEIAAIIHVGGAPIPLLANVPADSGIHLLPIVLNEALAKTYLPDQFVHSTYPALVPDDKPIPTIAVGDVMAVFAWPVHTERYNKATRFVNAFFGKFDRFQEPPRHPKWREVNLTAEVPGWTRFQPAQDWLAARQAAIASSDDSAVQARFNTFLAHARPGLNSSLSAEARNALFQQFVTWDRERSAAR
jgi:uncharacterized protein